MTLGVLILGIVVIPAANRFTHRAPRLPDTVGWIEHTLAVMSRADAVRTDTRPAARGMGDGVGGGAAGGCRGITASATHCTVQCRPIFRAAPNSFDVGLCAGGPYRRACQRGAAAYADTARRHAVTDGVCVPPGRHAGQLCGSAHARPRRDARCNT